MIASFEQKKKRKPIWKPEMENKEAFINGKKIRKEPSMPSILNSIRASQIGKCFRRFFSLQHAD